jgi:hypothetical protein
MKHSIRLLVFALTLVLSTAFNSSKAQIFNVGDIDLNAQIGFGTAWYVSNYSASMPLISFAGDYALRDDWGPGIFGVGALVGINTIKSEYYWAGYGDYGYRQTNFFIVPRATYHYQFVDKLDTYAGVATGLEISVDKEYGDWPGGYTATSEAGVGVVVTAFAGVKYYFTDNFAVMSELYVYDLAIFNIGVSLKL